MDDTRFWRWDTTPGEEAPPSIEPLSTASRATNEPDLTPTPLPQPIVNIQAAPPLPDPFGLASVLKTLGRSDIFKDVTGLEGSQKAALAAFTGALDVAKTMGGEAAKLAIQQEAGRSG